MARLKALEQIALYAPSVFDMHNSTITNFIVKEILLKNRNEVKEIEIENGRLKSVDLLIDDLPPFKSTNMERRIG